jgi:sulfate adenylyltransferase
VFELIGLDIKMFYGGPSEAVMHAIYRQNFGFSHLVIGRKHADAPYEDGKPIWATSMRRRCSTTSPASCT